MMEHLMRLFGVKGFPESSEIPTVVWHVRAIPADRAFQLVEGLPDAAGLRLVAVDTGCGLPVESVSQTMPWPWPDKAS